MTFIPVIASKLKGIKDDDNMVFVDTPGFRDNRGHVIDLSNAVSIKNVITSAETVRLLVVISYY